MKQKTTAQMRPLVTEFSNYVGTKKSYCAEHGMEVHTFDYWRKKLGDTGVRKSKPTGKFVALEVSQFKECPDQEVGVLEIRYRNGNCLVLPSTVNLSLLSNLLQITC